IPKQFLKRIERTGYGEFLFYDWRQDPDFELNRPGCDGARILVTGANFGCGSSRAHAAWALPDFGVDGRIAPPLRAIFFSNSVQLGLVPVVLPQSQVKELMESAGSGVDLTVDLERQTVSDASGHSFAFEIDPFVRHCLLNGLDSIGLTLRHEAAIGEFEARTTQPVATTAL